MNQALFVTKTKGLRRRINKSEEDKNVSNGPFFDFIEYKLKFEEIKKKYLKEKE